MQPEAVKVSEIYEEKKEKGVRNSDVQEYPTPYF